MDSAVLRMIRRIIFPKSEAAERIMQNWLSEYKKYTDMKKAGKTPRDIYLTAKADGFNSADLIRILWYICGLSPKEEKELRAQVDHGESLSEHQERLLPALKEVFEQEERNSAQNGNIPPKK